MRLALRKHSLVILILFSTSTIDAIVIPPARWGHVSVLCGNQLFVHGGHTGVNPLTAPIGSDLYSLDISTAFNSFSVPWTQLTPGPYAAFHTVGLMGPGNSVLAVYGGNTSFSGGSGTTNSNSLNLYNTVAGTWPASMLQDPPRREQQASASRLSDGTLFVYGGLVLSSDLMTEAASTELWTLGGYMSSNGNNNGSSNSNGTETNSTSTGTISSSPLAPVPTGISAGTAGWQKMTGTNGPMTDRSFHTLTIVRSNGLLVAIGGVSGGALVSMEDIWVYDTNAGTWSMQTAKGASPSPRRNHVAAATSTGQIYIHGGTDLGGTTFFSDVAILGLTAGGATNNIFLLDTTTNTWQSSYTPSNLALTSTKPEDWPGYKPPPVPPTFPPSSNGTDQPHPPSQPEKHLPTNVVSIVGGIVGALAFAAIVFVALRQRKRHHLINQQAKMASYYGADFSNQHYHLQRGGAGEMGGGYQLQEAYYQSPGMAFDSTPMSFGQRMDRFWSGLGAVAFWRNSGQGRRAANRSQSRRLEDQEDDDRESMRSLRLGPITDQDIFLDAVHRARSRVGRSSPVFTPLQQPIGLGSPIVGGIGSGEPQSPRSPKMISGGIGSPLRQSGTFESESGEGSVTTRGSSTVHERSYSDGFENSMLEMDVQMVAVPRGRLYVVNPSDEILGVVAEPGRSDLDLTQSSDQRHTQHHGV
ncbi:hypothetical protein EDD11_010543 [Mortierella claussenii]|nr:hypothetical protein EDD11_010543 [Mortierella claussenii]